MENRQLNTIDELVAAAVHDNSTYTLYSCTTTDFSNPEEGEKFRQAQEALKDKYRALVRERVNYWELPEYSKEYDALIRPKQVQVTKYHLTRTGGLRWHSYSIYLSSELGAMIASIWKERANKYGKRFVGHRTLASIATALGNTEVSSLVKQARVSEEQRRLKNLRNYNRRSAKEIVGKWNSLLTELEKAGQSKIFSIEELVNLANENMEE